MSKAPQKHARDGEVSPSRKSAREEIGLDKSSKKPPEEVEQRIALGHLADTTDHADISDESCTECAWCGCELVFEEDDMSFCDRCSAVFCDQCHNKRLVPLEVGDALSRRCRDGCATPTS